MRRGGAWALGLWVTFAVAGAARATSIQYQLTPLGGSHFRYEYTVKNDGSLGPGVPLELFDIEFDPTLYLETSLTIVTPASLQASWSELILPSQIGVPALYDVLATAGGLSVGQHVTGFAVEFDWLSSGQPGSQTFLVFDPVTFQPREVGLTVAALPPNPNPAPAPGTLLLALTGLATLGGWRARRRSISCNQVRHGPRIARA